MKKILVVLGVAVSALSISGCSKSVGYSGKNNAFPITENPDPFPTPTISPTGSPSPSPTPSPSPSIPVGDCDGKPLEPFARHSVFSTGSLTWNQTKTGGLTSARWSSVVTRSEIATALVDDAARNDIEVEDVLAITKTSVLHGRVVASKKIKYSELKAPFGRAIEKLPHLADQEKSLRSAQDYLSSLVSNGDVEVVCNQEQERKGECELILTGTNNYTNVFDVTRLELEDLKRIRFVVPPGSSAVVRIEGKKANELKIRCQEIDLGNLASNRLLWSVSSVQKLLIHGMKVPGTWVAPNTLVFANDTTFDGSVLSACVTANRTEWVLDSFSGCLPGRR